MFAGAALTAREQNGRIDATQISSDGSTRIRSLTKTTPTIRSRESCERREGGRRGRVRWRVHACMPSSLLMRRLVDGYARVAGGVDGLEDLECEQLVVSDRVNVGERRHDCADLPRAQK